MPRARKSEKGQRCQNNSATLFDLVAVRLGMRPKVAWALAQTPADFGLKPKLLFHLVPKLRLGTRLSAKLCFVRLRAAEVKLRRQSHSQVELGNEAEGVALHSADGHLSVRGVLPHSADGVVQTKPSTRVPRRQTDP